MKISSINYSQNFGLRKTKNFLNIQKDLIISADKSGRKYLAIIAATGITKLLPNDTLDFDNKHNKFILTVEKTKKQYDFGGAIIDLPLETLTMLYKNLSNFEKNCESNARPLQKKFIGK